MVHGNTIEHYVLIVLFKFHLNQSSTFESPFRGGIGG